MKGDVIAVLFIRCTLIHLLRIIHIHRIGKAVVRFADGILRIPSGWIVIWFTSAERRLSFAACYMFFTKWLAFYGRKGAFLITLTLIFLPRLFYLPC